MQRFYCDCGQEVFFQNTHCNACGAVLGFIPERQVLVSLQALEGHDAMWRCGSAEAPEVATTGMYRLYRRCEHHQHETIRCNWLIDAHTEPDASQCVSCRLTRMIPIQNIPDNVRRWATLESAKRRMLYGVMRLGLPFSQTQTAQAYPLIFDFLEDQRTNPDVAETQVLSGHASGVITLNVAEADSDYREATRAAMNEPYRTLLGHFRHEIGHFYWQSLVACDADKLAAFRQCFGDENRDYQQSLDGYYQQGADSNWQGQYISAYASSHPLEDWAESWAHYMHMSETLETALAFQLIPEMGDSNRFDAWLKEWMELVVVLNALNRSIGNEDAYPFVISEAVTEKLRFIHRIIHGG